MASSGNGSNEHGVPLEETWRTHLEQKFNSLHNEEPADVCIKIGSQEVLAHRLAIETNSKIIKACETCYSSKSGKLDVYLPQEFDGHRDLVFDIIQSFYSGDILITDNNIKMVYKFAKMYSVTWLLDHVLTLFIINEHTFCDIFKFAHMVWCDKLKDFCLQHLDSSLADKLVESGELFQMDYYSIQRLTVLDSTDQLPEIKVFDLICRWYENDAEKRKCHLEKLLFDIKYHLINKSDLVDFVLDWLINATYIEEKIKVQLIMAINKRIKDEDVSENSLKQPEKSCPTEKHPKLKSVNQVLAIIIDFTKKKGTVNQPEQVSASDFIRVVRQKFKTSDSLTKQYMVEYLSNYRNMINEKNITDFINLHMIDKTINLMKIIQRSSGYIDNVDYVHWEKLSYGALEEVMSVMDWKEPQHWLRGIAGLINWAQSHPTEVNKISTLFATFVSFSDIPEEYKKMLLPYMRKIFNDTEYEIACNAVECRSNNLASPPDCKIAALIEKFYVLENHESTVLDEMIYGGGRNQYYVRLRLGLSANNSNLQLIKKHFITKKSQDGTNYKSIPFVLFDSEKCLDNIPVYSYCGLDISELRELIVEYKNLHVMIFPNISFYSRS